jgi:type VI secretion system Hcp family effector
MAFRTVLLSLCLLLTASLQAQLRTDQAVRRNLLAGAETPVERDAFLVVEYAPGKTLPAGKGAPKGREDHIALTGFELGGSRADGGFGEVTVTKTTGESTAVLLEALDKGQVLPRVDIIVYRGGMVDPAEEWRVTLEQVTVEALENGFRTPNARVLQAPSIEETVRFGYAAITWVLDDGTSSYRAER